MICFFFLTKLRCDRSGVIGNIHIVPPVVIPPDIHVVFVQSLDYSGQVDLLSVVIPPDIHVVFVQSLDYSGQVDLLSGLAKIGGR